jgi:hypothetical protein
LSTRLTVSPTWGCLVAAVVPGFPVGVEIGCLGVVGAAVVVVTDLAGIVGVVVVVVVDLLGGLVAAAGLAGVMIVAPVTGVLMSRG